MTNNIIKAADYLSNKFSIKITKTGTGKLAKISEKALYTDKEFLVETPWCSAPGGIEKYVFNDNDPKYIIDICDNSGFLQELQKTDDIITNTTFTNSYKIFGKKYTEEQRDVPKALFMSAVRNDIPPPKIRLSVESIFKNGKRTDAPNITLFRKGVLEPISVKSFEDLQKQVDQNNMVKAIIAPFPWCKYKEKYGLKWCVVQLLIEKQHTSNMFSPTASE